MRRFAHATAALAGFACWGSCLLAIVVRLTVRDAVEPWSSVVYYAMPPAVMAVICFLGALLFRIGGRRQWAVAASVTGLVCLAWWYHTSYFRNQPQPAAESIRVLFWNASRGLLGWSKVVDEVRRIDADVTGLVEAGHNNLRTRHFWQQEFPNHKLAVFDRGMVLLVRGDIVGTRAIHLPSGGGQACVDVLVDGKRMTVVLVDLTSNPFRSRRAPLEKLSSALRELSGDQPVLVLGDFNTPSDSVFLNGIRRDFSSAFETAGRGFSATWPVPFPVLTIDQVWANRHVDVHDCRLDWTWQSDHRPVLTDVSIVRQPSKPTQPHLNP